MNLTIRFVGSYWALFGKDQLSVETEKPTVVNEVIEKVARSIAPESKRLLIDPELDDPRPNALILVNGREISVLDGLETKVHDGDEIALIPVSHRG